MRERSACSPKRCPDWGSSSALGTAVRTGPAENEDSFYAGILNLDSSVFILPRFSSMVYQCAKPHEPRPATIIRICHAKDGAIKMIRKIALRLVAITLI